MTMTRVDFVHCKCTRALHTREHNGSCEDTPVNSGVAVPMNASSKKTSPVEKKVSQLKCCVHSRSTREGGWCTVRNENIKKNSQHNSNWVQLHLYAIYLLFDILIPFHSIQPTRESREEKKVQEWQSGKQIWAICKPDNANRRTRHVYSYKYLSMLSGSWGGESTMRVSAWCSSNDDAEKNLWFVFYSSISNWVMINFRRFNSPTRSKFPTESALKRSLMCG